ncbi:MAG TPA: monofunctional biosynthetic peptidoglycan transglycosylase [Steroidobacteraceae bacterium]|nr:monofunctional biosynthetic peptidoglycan transglycosylase [Steroidobacteraceae bacterium]
MSTRSGRQGGRASWLLKGVVTLLLAFMVLTVLPVLLLRWIDPFTSSFMIQAKARAISAGQSGYETHYRWVDLEQISPHAALAVIASEDQQFPFHAGFDLKSIRQAVRENAHRKRPRGASTISQQVAKNLFLWNGASYVRKGIEAWLTVLIETLWPKERILEMYLNIAQFGPGVYGVEAASQRYFRKPASRLTRAEAATLAAVLPNPVRMHADRPSPYVMSRRDWILGQMHLLGGRQYLESVEPRAAAR